ncbi:MAG TPA: MFS transporter [Dehalococcoidia bacterium]|nr:MFS transporter [Dehalococcoidia bacterium]
MKPTKGRRRTPDPGDVGRVAGRAYRHADGLIDRGERHVFRVLWFFLPETSIARSRRFQTVMASTFLSDGGRDALRYGALIAVVRDTGSTIDAALVGVASLLPPTLLGLYGGAIADALPRRLALTAVYAAQATLCLAVPALFGTDLRAVLFLVLAVNVLGQVSTPGEQAIAPMVASDAQLASANSLLSLSSNLGTVFGTALLAPILLQVAGVRAVFAVSGVMLFIATGRIMHLRARSGTPPPRWRRPNVNVPSVIRWLADEPAVGTMVIVGVLAGTANVVLVTLAPRYVQSVLGLDPADTVYVFGPSSLGLAVALLGAPALIRRVGERMSALGGFAITAVSLALLGFVHYGLANVIDPVNPFRLLDVFGVHPGPALRTASALAVPLGLGISLTTMSVQTYINRRVPLARQGRTFALQSTLKNGAAIAPLLLLGATASVFGVNNVLIAAPFMLVVLAFALVRLSERFGGHAPTRRLDVLASFWRTTDGPDPAAGVPDA